MPGPIAWPIACGVSGYGAWCAWNEMRRAHRDIVIAGDEAASTTVDGIPVQDFSVRWRGSLAFMRWREDGGRIRHAVFWPDTLPPAQRRELRLAAPGPAAARPVASVAP